MFGVYKGDDDEDPPPDVRYSWTMRAFQILSGHYQAVADSLDHEGQIIARLSWVGFKPESDDPKDIEAVEYLLTKFSDENKSEELIERLKIAFPVHSTVGDITITAVHGVDSEDLLGFSAETLTLLGDEADRARKILETHGGMSIDQMKANAILRRKFPDDWSPLNKLPKIERENIKKMIGSSYHPLVLRLRGPGSNFIADLQGQDIVIFSITHPEILKLNPAHLRDLMLLGRPNSALCALDYVAQGRHRCWYERDVMLWYAACRGITQNGKLNLDWDSRDSCRQSVYQAFGTGKDQYYPMLGTSLRSEVARQERRSIEIWKAARDVLNKYNSKCDKNILEDSKKNYELILIFNLSNGKLANEVLHYQQYAQQILMAKRYKSRDKIIQESLQKLNSTPKDEIAKSFTVIDWLSIGGIFLTNGTPENYQDQILNVIQTVKNIMNDIKIKNINDEEDKIIKKLIVCQLQPNRMTLGERKGEMFSVKASEDCKTRAIARRTQLALQTNEQLAINKRLKGFENSIEKKLDLKTIVNNARKIMIDLSDTPLNKSYSIESVNEKFGHVIKYSIIALETVIENTMNSCLKLEKQDLILKESMINSLNSLFKNGIVDLKILDLFCGTYENHGYISKLLEYTSSSSLINDAIEDILSVNELLCFLLALEKTNSFLSQRYQNQYDFDFSPTNFWRKLAEFFAKTIDDHFYEYNPWILDSKRGSKFVKLYDDVGIIKQEYKQNLYLVSWKHHRILYKYFLNLINHHSDLVIKIPNKDDRDLLIGFVKLGNQFDGSQDVVEITPIGNYGVGEENREDSASKNFELLWRCYNQLREISFIKNDDFEFPVVFSSFDSKFLAGLDSNSNPRVNLAILSPIGRTHYSRAIMESSFLNDNIFITRTGFFSNDGKKKLKLNEISREKSYLFIEDAHFYLNQDEYYMALKYHYGLSDEEANEQIEIDKKYGRISGKGIRLAAKFNEPILIGCCIAHHHHPLEIGLTLAGYPSTDKSPFLFDLTYNKSLYPIIYSNDSNKSVLLPPQIDWLQEETISILNKHNGNHQIAENAVIEAIKNRLRPFAVDHNIIIAKGSAESGARNLSRFDIRDSENTINEEVLNKASKFIYEVSKGQNVTIQRAIISTPLAWMTENSVKKFIERQIIEHSVSVNIEKYPKDFIYGTLRVILSASVPKLDDLSNLSNWEASHLLSLSSLQTATNVGRQGTLEMLVNDMVHSKFRKRFIEQLEESGKRTMSLTSIFGQKYWYEDTYIDGTGKSYDQSSPNDIKYKCQKVLPYNKRNPNLPEKDACGVPYWWPRYLMLDFVPEAIFVDNESKVINGAYIIDIDLKGSQNDQPIFTVSNENGQIYYDAKIIDFKFWLLEPNVGIGLWPNYWKRELVRCQEISNNIDYGHIGVSDRIVLKNFIKAGYEFLSIKKKTNHLPSFHIKTFDNLLVSKKEACCAPSKIATCLYFALSNISLKHGIISIGITEVSVWISESLSVYIKNDTEYNKFECLSEKFDYFLKLINSISKQDINYCLRKQSSDKQFKSVYRAKITINEKNLIDWLSNIAFKTRICEILLDSLISESMSPFIRISPIKFPSSLKLIPHYKTFAIISEKTALINHQIYPFVVGCGDFPINIIGVHSSWVFEKSNVTSRAILFDSQTNCFIETSLMKPLVIHYCFIVELNQTDEIKTHDTLSKKYEEAKMIVINNSKFCREKCDDKVWIRENIPLDIMIPNYILLSQQDILDEDQTNQRLKAFLNKCQKGVIVQPSANTTESFLTEWISSSNTNQILLTCKNILYSLKKMNADLSSKSIMISEFRGNVLYKEAPVVFRFNVSNFTNVTVASYVGSIKNKIVALKGTSPNTNLGYCERLDKVLTFLSQEKTNKKIEINSKKWNLILNKVCLVAQKVGLPLVGIDILLEYVEDQLNPILIEVNGRPGTLIFGEKLYFNESGSNFTYSLMSPPIDSEFWNYLIKLGSNNYINSPKTLLDWKKLMSSNEISELIENFSLQFFNCIHALNFFKKRYNLNDKELLIDRILALSKTIDDAILAGDFNLNANVSIIFSNGRDRYFGGHTDLLGLGGPTINGTTQNEIISIIQKSNDSIIHVTNSNNEYESEKFVIEDILSVLDKLKNCKTKAEKLWDQNLWTSYLKGSLAFMLSLDFNSSSRVRSCLYRNDRWAGFRMHFNTSGRLKLLTGIGSSSSSALTSAFVLGLNQIFELGLCNIELSQTDYGEFYLGKTAGCADKTTILNAIKGEIVFVSSIPERFITSLRLPESIVIIMANSNIPRLNSPNGRKYLSQLKENNSNHALYTNEKIQSIIDWSNRVMKQFGSLVFINSVETIIKSLFDENIYSKANITKKEANDVLNSFGIEIDISSYDLYASLSSKIFFNNDKALLRELSSGGYLEKRLGYQKHQRYNLIFRLLKLLPESSVINIEDEYLRIYPRKSTLYGISEIERCYEYISLMNSLNISNSNEFVSKILDLVRWAHDGDRAFVDYRNDFKPTNWSNNARSFVSDDTLDNWIENENEELVNKSGGFERSLPEFDEWADKLDEVFEKKAALRVSAAGLGGTVCIHSLRSISSDVILWLQKYGLAPKIIHPGPSYNIIN